MRAGSGRPPSHLPPPPLTIDWAKCMRHNFTAGSWLDCCLAGAAAESGAISGQTENMLFIHDVCAAQIIVWAMSVCCRLASPVVYLLPYLVMASLKGIVFCFVVGWIPKCSACISPLL